MGESDKILALCNEESQRSAIGFRHSDQLIADSERTLTQLSEEDQAFFETHRNASPPAVPDRNLSAGRFDGFRWLFRALWG